MAENVRWITAAEAAETYEPIGGGGGGELKVANVTIAHSDILTLPTARVQLVAGVANKQLQPFLIVGISDATAGAYIGVDNNATFTVYWGVDANVQATGANPSGWVLSDNSQLWQFTLPMFLIASGASVTGSQGDNVAGGLGLFLQCGNPSFGDPDFTGGNAANTLKLSVYYTEISL